MATVTVIQPITVTDTNKLRVAAYCRVSSSSEDQLNSYQAQLTYYSHKFEDSVTEELVDLYADEGITGTRDDKRDEFQRLMTEHYKTILQPLQYALQELKFRKFSGNPRVMDIHKEIAKLREQVHVLSRLKTKGFLDEAKYQEQTTELNAKINRLQQELKRMTRSDEEDESLDQIEMLTDLFEKREKLMTEFEPDMFESIVDRIVVKSRSELEFNLIGGLKLTEKI